MRRFLKNFFAAFMALNMCVIFAVPAFAAGTTDEFLDEHGVLVKEVSIDPYDSVQAEKIISTYHVQPETAETIRSYLKACKNGAESLTSITLTIPTMTEGRSSGSTRTYKGYGNKTYYEETITAYGDPGWIDVGGGLWENYVNDTAQAIGEYIVDGVVDTVTGGVWSIAKLFAPNSVPSGHTVTHSAAIHEVKTAKHTYVVENGQYYFGSLVQRSSGYFQNSILDTDSNPHRYIDGADATLTAVQTPNYNSPDKKAYYGYVSSGWTETVAGFEYCGVYFESIGA